MFEGLEGAPVMVVGYSTHQVRRSSAFHNPPHLLSLFLFMKPSHICMWNKVLSCILACYIFTHITDCSCFNLGSLRQCKWYMISPPSWTLMIRIGYGRLWNIMNHTLTLNSYLIEHRKNKVPKYSSTINSDLGISDSSLIPNNCLHL